MIRPATPADRAAVHALYKAFWDERPPPAHVVWEDELAEVDDYLERHVVLLAEEEGVPVGLALAQVKKGPIGYLSDLYVRPEFRRRGLARALIVEVAAHLGVPTLTLNVDVANDGARAAYRRLGFREESLNLEIDTAQLGRPEEGPSSGSVYVQTDDEAPLRRLLGRFVPRLPDARIEPTGTGWTLLADVELDRDPKLLRRLAQELSSGTGAVVLALGIEAGAVVRYILYDRGGIVDEYLSVPEHFGPLPPGDAIALRANPTVAARLTGAEPAQVRAVARTAGSPAELPPPAELLAQLAAVLGVASSA